MPLRLVVPLARELRPRVAAVVPSPPPPVKLLPVAIVVAADVVEVAGATAGGFYGGRLARKVNQRFLRIAVTAFGFCLAAVYFVRIFG